MRKPPPRARRAVVLEPGSPGVPRDESVAEFLGRASLFADLAPEQRAQLAARTRVCHLEAGQWLFHEGEIAAAMYVVRAGRLEVVDESSASVLRELGRADALGELALLTDGRAPPPSVPLEAPT